MKSLLKSKDNNTKLKDYFFYSKNTFISRFLSAFDWMGAASNLKDLDLKKDIDELSITADWNAVRDDLYNSINSI